MLLDIIKAILSLFSKQEEHKPQVVAEKPKLLTYEQILAINDNKNPDMCKYYIDALNKVLPEYKIDTKLRLSHFLAQILHESGNFRYKSENLNYSATALRSVFPKYFKTNAIANEYARKPEKIGNRVYANRMGNGNETSGDGFKYRGRGLIQLTGKSNYRACGEDLGIDLLKLPDLIISDPEICVKTACWFWNRNNLNSLADQDDIKTITKRINGGFNGLEDRQRLLARAKQVLFTS